MRDNHKKGVQPPHSPLMAEINPEKLLDAIELNHDADETIIDCYVKNSNALIELFINEEIKNSAHYHVILTAMYQQHLLLYYNLTDNDDETE